LGRKKLYPLVFLIGIFAYLDYSQLYLLSGSFVPWDVVHGSFFMAVGLYLLSFIDVILTSQAVCRGAKQVPDPFSWWKALGAHLSGGFGLAYANGGLKRKFLYPLAFFLAVFAVVDQNEVYVISDVIGWEPVEITLRLAVVVYLFSFIDLVLTGQAVSRGSKPLSGHLSWWRTVGLHLVFGFGLASIDSSVRRRWLYPVAFFCGLLIYIDLQEYYFLPDYLGDDLVIALFLSALVIYLFGFIDVILTQQSIGRGSKNIPDVLSLAKALGFHFCGGYGLAYMDSSLKRRWLYPAVFLLLVLRLIVLLEPDFLFRYPLDHFLYVQAREILDLIFYVSLAVFVLGIADVLLTFRSRMKIHP
jgi:hypothetical protein